MDNKKPTLPSRSASPTSGEFLSLSERKWRPVRNQKHFRTPFRTRNLRNWRGLVRKYGMKCVLEISERCWRYWILGSGLGFLIPGSQRRCSDPVAAPVATLAATPFHAFSPIKTRVVATVAAQRGVHTDHAAPGGVIHHLRVRDTPTLASVCAPDLP